MMKQFPSRDRIGHRLVALNVLVALVLSALLSFGQAKDTITLYRAIRDGKVTATFEARGASSGDSITVDVAKSPGAGPGPLRLTVPAGTILENGNAAGQGMVVAGVRGLITGPLTYEPTSTIYVPSRKPKAYVLSAFCINFEKDNPGSSDALSVGQRDPVLACILRRSTSLTVAARQAAVWIDTDHVTYDQMGQKFPVTPDEFSEGQAVFNRCQSAVRPVSQTLQTPLAIQQPVLISPPVQPQPVVIQPTPLRPDQRAFIENVWTEYNTWSGGTKGMTVHIKLQTANLQQEPLQAAAFFYDAVGNQLTWVGVGGSPSAANNLFVSETLVPAYQFTTYNDLTLFYPLCSFGYLGNGTRQLKYLVVIRTNPGATELARSTWQFFNWYPSGQPAPPAIMIQPQPAIAIQPAPAPVMIPPQASEQDFPVWHDHPSGFGGGLSAPGDLYISNSGVRYEEIVAKGNGGTHKHDFSVSCEDILGAGKSNKRWFGAAAFHITVPKGNYNFYAKPQTAGQRDYILKTLWEDCHFHGSPG